MDTKHHDSPQHQEDSVKKGHELRDVSTRPIAYFAVGLFLLVLVSLWLMRGLFVIFEDREERSSPQPPALAAGRPQQPPEPRLQTAPAAALQQKMSAEENLLSSYGWTDQANGVVRIPVQRAMELLVERGLSSRPTDPAFQQNPGSAQQEKAFRKTASPRR